MRFSLIAIGRMRGSPHADLFAHYAARLRPPLSLREVEGPKGEPMARMRREAQLLLDAVPVGDCRLVALDGGGVALSSEGFAAQIGAWRDQGIRQAVFLIGGPFGHGRQLLDRADLRLSLGPMTWPHLLCRVMLAEQLYRASAIHSGHPYHQRQ